jgi:hypothetical protein
MMTEQREVERHMPQDVYWDQVCQQTSNQTNKRQAKPTNVKQKQQM